MKIYTKTGDKGMTGLFGGGRVSKALPRVDAYGEIDELNCVLGAVCAHVQDAATAAMLQNIQGELFAIGAELAKTPGKDVDLGIALVDERDIVQLEQAIDQREAELSPLKTFVLPGGTIEASLLHLARATCRRAERKLVALDEADTLRPELLRYVNRLSDLLFVMARHANFRASVEDVPWLGRKAR